MDNLIQPIKTDQQPAIKIGPTKMLIGGQWVDMTSGRPFATINPATEEIIAQVAGGRGG